MQWKVHTLRAQKNKWMSLNWSALQLGEGLQMTDGCVMTFLLDICWTIMRKLIAVIFKIYKCICNLLCFAYSRKLKVLSRLIQWLSSKESACNRGDAKTLVWSLGGEDHLKKATGTHFMSSPEKAHKRSLVGYSPKGHKEWADTTEWLSTHTRNRQMAEN